MQPSRSRFVMFQRKTHVFQSKLLQTTCIHRRAQRWSQRVTNSWPATAAFQRLGFSSAVAVDNTQPKFSHASVIALDLTSPDHQSLVMEWLRHDRPVAVFMTPPCGTCSFAHNILLENGPSAPRPLRSTAQPDGLQGLSYNERLRVSQAKFQHDFCQQVFELCTQLNKPCMVENPRTQPLHMYQAQQACACGGKRPKWSHLAATFRQVTMINRVCDGLHHHEPWGKVTSESKQVFAANLEAHYPQKLCDTIAQSFLIRLQQ